MKFHLCFQALHLRSKRDIYSSILTFPFCSLFSTSSLVCRRISTCSKTPYPGKKDPVVFNYLVETLKFSKANALKVSEHFANLNSTTKINKAVCFLRSFGFSDAQIASSVLVFPRILSLSIEKNLIPKLIFFQDLGFSGTSLADFVSKRPSLLDNSLETKFKPCVRIINEILENGRSCKMDDGCNKDLLFILSRCCWLIPAATRLSSNIAVLKCSGIDGPDLSNLLKREPRVFISNEENLKKNISEVLDMGFVEGSQMFIRALRARCSLSDETLRKKFKVFESFGISRDELIGMIRKTPYTMKLSEANIRSELEFLLLHLKLEKSVLINRPLILSYSMEKRVMPRYRIFEHIKSHGIMKKVPKFVTLLELSEEEFLEKYVLRFGNKFEELWLSSKGRVFDARTED